MDALRSSDEVRAIVENALEKRFPRVDVVAINVRDSEDEDGDKIIDIVIVFEAKNKDFDPAKVPPFVSEIVDKLSEAEDSRFPVLSFISKSDLGKTKPEAA